MIRIICREINEAGACNVGSPVDVYYQTFDIESVKLEAWLRDQVQYQKKMVLGAEVLPDTPPKSDMRTWGAENRVDAEREGT